MAKHEEWYDDGRWVGPPDLRLFLGENRFFGAFWYLGLTVLTVAITCDVADSVLIGIPLGITVGAFVWFVLGGESS
jgi:hypothetical protein